MKSYACLYLVPRYLLQPAGVISEIVHVLFFKGRGKQEAHVTPMKLNDGMGTIVNGQLATQQDKVITFSSICCEDENGEVEPISSSEPVTNETHANLFRDVNGEEGVSISTSFPEDAMVISIIMKSCACLYS